MMMWTTRKRLPDFGPTWPEVTAARNGGFFAPKNKMKNGGNLIMGFFTSAVSTLQTLVVALGAGLAVWGVINLLEGYGSDNPGAKSQGMKQLMAGGGIILLGTTLVPLLSGLF
jgi:hypothetical protein